MPAGITGVSVQRVMLRAARRWEPTEDQARRDGVAFSYLRADLNIEEVWAPYATLYNEILIAAWPTPRRDGAMGPHRQVGSARRCRSALQLS